MSLDSEITLLKTSIKNAYDSLATKGATIPQNKCAVNLKDCIDTLAFNDMANVINAKNCTGSTLSKGEKVFVTTINPDTSTESGGYFIIDFSNIPNNHIYTAVTSADCESLAYVDVFTVLESTVMTNAENDSFIYDVI